MLVAHDVDEALRLAEHQVGNVVVLQREAAHAPLTPSRDVDWDEAVAAAERGEIADAQSIIGLFWLARLRGG